MHEFHYRDNEFYCEDVRVRDLALKFGTPLYVYSQKTILDHYRKLKKAFSPVRPLICFSVKSNSNLSILKMLIRQGAGLDIVSGGELARALRIKADPKKIVYASVGKTKQEIKEALRAGIFFFNVESLQELAAVSEAALQAKKVARVCVRLNPNIDAHTHRYITTGTVESKFGVDLEMARLIFLNRDHFKNVKILGLHVHIGSQITQVGPFLSALKRIVALIAELKKLGVRLEWLNIGGGLGIIYKDEKPQTAAEFAAGVLPLLKKTRLKIILEPGRFIVGNAGILLARVLYIKETPAKRFVVVDAGMNDLIRPALYEAYHEIAPLDRSRVARRVGMRTSDVVGPVCESGDFLAKDRPLPLFEAGDVLAVMGAGAYGFSMASNYNSRCRPAEVLVKGHRYQLIRRRETFTDLMKQEKVVRL
ncbi:MAG: diaminopimelate decarboxylase [Candidatus Omnitrophota bacterium]